MNKIDINKVNIVPKSITDDFKLCVYGNPTSIILEWINYHQLQTYYKDNYTNIILSTQNQLYDIFDFNQPIFEYMDGFSPNLNKKLHIGHFSNLVLSKAFKSLGICNKTVSIYGDTLKTETISKEEALTILTQYQNDFNFVSDKTFMASEMILNNDDNNNICLKDGTGKYEGTMVFEINDEKIVGIKSNRFETSYFYQDVALAQTLNASTIYLTGKEQSNHFKLLKNLFPNNNIHHIGLGLVKISGLKMASRVGNVIFIEDFINDLNIMFDNNTQLIYNVFAGFILKSNPEVDKNIDLDLITNPKNSNGLYISYTMARLISAGCDKNVHYDNYHFASKHLQFAHIKAKQNLKPNILFEALVEHCKEINYLYGTHIIKDNSDNKLMFDIKLCDLIHGAKLLGLFVIDKV